MGSYFLFGRSTAYPSHQSHHFVFPPSVGRAGWEGQHGQTGQTNATLLQRGQGAVLGISVASSFSDTFLPVGLFYQIQSGTKFGNVVSRMSLKFASLISLGCPLVLFPLFLTQTSHPQFPITHPRQLSLTSVLSVQAILVSVILAGLFTVNLVVTLFQNYYKFYFPN